MRRTRQTATNELSSKVATQIVDLIRKNDLPTGAHLTEQSIVESCHVSRSPVRKAMALLAGLGVLRSEKNRGYFVHKSGRSLDRIAVAPPELNLEDVYLQITDDRLKGGLGQHVSESEIRRRYTLTHAQAQQILHRMAREDLIVRKSGRGWMFEPILDTSEAHDQSYRFRMIIEPAALLEPTFAIDRVALARLRREQAAMLEGDIYKLSRARIFQVGAEFHETIVSWSGNRFLSDTIRRQNNLRRLIEYRGNVDRSRLVKQCQEHLRLLDLIESGNIAAAVAFLRGHLDVVRSIKTGVARTKRVPERAVAALHL